MRPLPSPKKRTSAAARKLEEKGGLRLDKTKFEDGLRVLTKNLHSNEFNFRDVPVEEAEFAVFWECRRELEKYYRGHWKPHKDGTRIYRPAKGLSLAALHWAMNMQYFPLPYVEIKKMGLLSFLGTPSPPAVHEEDFFEFRRIFEDTQLPIWRRINQFGTQSFSKHVFAPVQEGAKRIPPIFNPESSLSMHCLVLDWSRGSKTIQREIEKWVKKMTYLHPAPAQSVYEKRLDQIGAWRAKRAGLNAQEYLDLRMRTFGCKKTSEMKRDHVLYEDPSTFRTASKTAEKFIRSID